MLAMSGALTDAISVLSATMLPKSPSFVKKPEFSQEVVSLMLDCQSNDIYATYYIKNNTIRHKLAEDALGKCLNLILQLILVLLFWK